MYEKSKLIEMFKKVKRAAEEAREDRVSVQGDSLLSEKGKEKKQIEIRKEFNEAVNLYRDEMLALVDAREADFTAYYVKVAKDRLLSDTYMGKLMASLDILKKGYMSKIEVMALVELYNYNDSAMDMIMDVMRETKSQYMDLIPERITIKMQLNAFESIRGVIRSKVNVNLLDISSKYTGKTTYSFNDSKPARDDIYAYFGSGYYAIVNELNDDLTLNSPSATLGKINNAVTGETLHECTNSFDTIVNNNNKRDNMAAEENSRSNNN